MNVILGVAVLAAIIWGLAFLRHGGLFALSLVTLAAGVCLSAAFFQVSVVTLDRLLIGAMVGLYFLGRKTHLIDPKPLHRIDWWFAAFLAFLLFCTLAHDWKADGAKPVSRYLFFYILPAVMYWLARQLPVNERSIRLALFAIGLFGVYLAGTAVAEWKNIYAVVFPKYIVSAEYEEFLGRGRGPLLNPVGNGILMCVSLASVMCLWPHVGRFGKTLVVAIFVLMMAGVFATLTRSVWIGAVLGVLLIIHLSFPWRAKVAFVVGSTLCLSILVAANIDKLDRFKRDKNVSESDMSNSSDLRPVLALVAWRIFQDHPFAGVGLAQYKKHDKFYLEEHTTNLNMDAARPYVQHNLFLSYLTETGAIGLGLYLGLLVLWTNSAMILWNTHGAPLEVRQVGLIFVVLMAALGCNGMFHDVSIIDMMNTTVFYSGGLIVGLRLRYAPNQKVGLTWPNLAPARARLRSLLASSEQASFGG